MDWRCGACGAQWAPGAPCCPECRSVEHAEEGGVPKILPNGVVTYEPGREPGGPLVQPGTGVPMEAAEVTADGTGATVAGEGDGGEPFTVEDGGIAGPEGLEVLTAPAEGAAEPLAQDAAPAPEAAAAPVPPRLPPRRTPPGG